MGILEQAVKLFGDFVEISAERNELHKKQLAFQERQIALAESKSTKTESTLVTRSVGDLSISEETTTFTEGPIAVEFESDQSPTEVETEKAERERKVEAITAAGRYEEVKGCGMKKVREVFESLSDEEPVAELEHPSLFPTEPSPAAAAVEAVQEPAPMQIVEPELVPAAVAPASNLLDDEPVVVKTFTKDEVKTELLKFQAANGDVELARIIQDIGGSATFGQVDPVNYGKMMAAMGYGA